MKINMKSLGSFFSVVLLFGVINTFAQQSPQVTAIFQKNFCQTYNSSRTTSFSVDFQIAGITDQDLLNFKTTALKTDGIINFFVDAKSVHGLRRVMIEFAPQADFDFIRTVLQDNGIRFINEDDRIVSIYDWKPFTNEECSKIYMLNTQINNVETKLNHTMNEPTQKAMAEENGWFIEANRLLKEAIDAKKTYIETIK